MKIKEVEKLTGLTAKSIRHYEAKGLITVARQEDNSYRAYTEEDVKRLKQIKLLRYLDFSIAQIREMQDMEEEKVQEILQEKAEEFSDRGRECGIKEGLCESLSKDSVLRDEVVDEYNETVEFLESDEMEELAESLKDFSCPSLSEVIVQTMVLLAPILSLFLNIAQKLWSAMLLNSIFAIACTACLTGTWMSYVRKAKYQKKRVKKKNRQNWWIIPVLLLAIVATVAVFVGVAVLMEKIMSPKGWLFYEYDSRVMVPMIVLLMLPVLLLLVGLVVALRRKHGEKALEDDWESGGIWVWFAVRKHKMAALVLWVIGMYVCLTNVTFVTGDEIIRHTPFCPMGRNYSYDEVTDVTTGFGTSNFAIREYKKKGTFSYIITVGGKKVVFSAPSTNETIRRFEEHTYLELEEFDRELMKRGIAKESDDRYADYCDLDQEYVDRFLRIIHNQPQKK